MAQPPRALSSAEAARVREVLGACDLVAAQRLGETIGPGLFDVVRAPLVLVELQARTDPWAAPGRLLRFGGLVARAEVNASLGTDVADILIDCGVVAVQPDGLLVSPFRLLSFAGTWVLADPNDAGPDAVMQPGPTTQELLDVVPTRTDGPVLDVGAGPGSLALALAARGQGPVVAIDVNERACAFARFNAALNDLPIDVRQGDLLAPVAGERFALVVSQPPYVVLPVGVERVTFLHGTDPAEADDPDEPAAWPGATPLTLMERLLAGVPSVLTPNGVAVIVADVHGTTPTDRADGEDDPDGGLAQRWGEVIAMGADLLVLEAAGPTAEQQAIGYATVAADDLGVSLGEAARRYRTHLAGLGARQAIRGLAVVRPGPPDRPVRALGLDVAELPMSWDAIRFLLAAADLAAAPDGDLTAARLAAWPGSVLAEIWSAGRRDTPVFELRGAANGVASTRELNQASAVLFEVLATAASVADAAVAFAEACGQEVEELAGQVLTVAREGLREGVLVPHETLAWLDSS